MKRLNLNWTREWRTGNWGILMYLIGEIPTIVRFGASRFHGARCIVPESDLAIENKAEP